MLTGFTAGLLLITVSELGDKTFFIAMILAMRHPKSLVFVGVMAALAAMTAISVLMGQVISLFPRIYVHYAEISLLVGFGVSLIWQAIHMSSSACLNELSEAETTLAQSKLKFFSKGNGLLILLEAFVLTFLGEWGDRTQFATVTLASGNNPVGVTLGAIFGHGICTTIAITCGCLLSDRLSERNITFCGGLLFLVFAVVAWFR